VPSLSVGFVIKVILPWEELNGTGYKKMGKELIILESGLNRIK